jgi:hypothetical protein
MRQDDLWGSGLGRSEIPRLSPQATPGYRARQISGKGVYFRAREDWGKDRPDGVGIAADTFAILINRINRYATGQAA